jgi:hypothetical protein
MQILESCDYFYKLVKREFLSTLNIYRSIIRKPSLIWLWIYQVLRDIFFELPQSLLKRHRHNNLEQRIEESSSQALIISEIMTIPGNYIGFWLMKAFWSNNYTASLFWANAGDYIFAILFGSSSFILLTRWHWNAYTIKNALITEIQAIKDCIPASIILYISEAPLLAGLIYLKIPPNIAIAINLIIAITLFIWVAKISYNTHIEEALSERYKS